MRIHIFFIKDDEEFFGSLTQEDKNFYMSLDMDLEKYNRETGIVKEFTEIRDFFQFVQNISSDGVILTVEKGRVNLTVFNE
ncbi:MAG: hypothetical protein WC775_06310 [Patescibacteria group bacterium]|jgi:hypothetical protein